MNRATPKALDLTIPLQLYQFAATRICDPKLFFPTQSTSVTWVTAQDTRSDYFIFEAHGVDASQGVVDHNARIVRATPHESPARVALDMSAFEGKADMAF